MGIGLIASSRASAGPQYDLASALVVFTTVDGTLRDRKGGPCVHVRAALGLLASQDIPVILAGEQSPDELMWLQSELGFRHPFIADNGAALYTPVGCFTELHGLGEWAGDWEIIAFHAARDPGQAVRLLISLYGLREETVVSIGLGAEWRDRALLGEVDVPVIVRNEGIDQTRLIRRIPAAYVTSGAGPAGWSEAILGSVGEGT